MSTEDQKSNASLAGQGFSRRKVLSLGGSLAAASLVALMNHAVPAGQFDGKQVVFASWGGAYQDAQKECYCVPFEKKTGPKVLQDGPMDEAKFRTMVQSGNPVWDMVDVTHEFLYNGIKNDLFEKLELSKIDVSRISPRYRTDYGIGDIVWSYNIGYSTKQFTEDNHPKSWADVFDTKKFSGSRTMPGNTPAPAMEVALMADGVTPGELYKMLATPEGVKRAFDKLSSIKQQIIFWETNSKSQQLFADGEVSCGVILNGRAYDAAQKGVPIAIDWNQNIQSIDYLVISARQQERGYCTWADQRDDGSREPSQARQQDRVFAHQFRCLRGHRCQSCAVACNKPGECRQRLRDRSRLLAGPSGKAHRRMGGLEAQLIAV